MPREWVDADGDGLDDDYGFTREQFDRNFNGAAVTDPTHWADVDNDGKDDSTGMSRTHYDGATEGERAGYRHTREQASGGTYRDSDNDGYDDGTGLSRVMFDRAPDSERQQRSQQRADVEAAGAYERRQQEYDDYASSGDRAADLDAGRRPMRRDGGGRDSGSGGGGGGGGGGSNVSDFDRDVNGIWLLDDLSGASGRRSAANAADAEARNRGVWEDLENYWYSPEDMSVDYGQLKGSQLAGATGDAASMASERDALAGLEDIYQHEGLTAADRARLDLGAAEAGSQMRSQRDADMSQLRARGMGGSGAALNAMNSSQQGGANTMAQREMQMQIAAQQRQMQALQGAGDMSSRMRAQGWNEDTTRRGAVDERDEYNHGWRAKTLDSQHDAREADMQRRMDQAAGITGQYAGDQSRRAGEQDDQEENSKGVVNALGELIDSF